MDPIQGIFVPSYFAQEEGIRKSFYDVDIYFRVIVLKYSCIIMLTLWQVFAIFADASTFIQNKFAINVFSFVKHNFPVQQLSHCWGDNVQIDFFLCVYGFSSFYWNLKHSHTSDDNEKKIP